MNKKVLIITGAGGWLGYSLIKYLIKQIESKYFYKIILCSQKITENKNTTNAASEPHVPGANGKRPIPNRVEIKAKGDEKTENFLLIKMIVSPFLKSY